MINPQRSLPRRSSKHGQERRHHFRLVVLPWNLSITKHTLNVPNLSHTLLHSLLYWLNCIFVNICFIFWHQTTVFLQPTYIWSPYLVYRDFNSLNYSKIFVIFLAKNKVNYKLKVSMNYSYLLYVQISYDWWNLSKKLYSIWLEVSIISQRWNTFLIENIF